MSGEEEEAAFPLRREPDAGINPRTLGSWLKPKAHAQVTESPGVS